MGKLLFSLIIGAAAGLIDNVPMLIQKLDKYSILSAFLQWLVAGFIICHVQLGVAGWLKGLIVAVAMAVPIVVLQLKTDPKSVVPILAMSMILGSVTGFISTKIAG